MKNLGKNKVVVFDADAITIDSEIPALPKKSELLKKPELEDIK